VIAELRATPGVSAAALASRLPLAPDVNLEGIQIRGLHQPKDEPTPIDAVRVGSDYFRAVGVPLVEGRAFTEDEVEREAKVVVVNEAFGRKYWPGQSALGQPVYVAGFDHQPHVVVGVARDHKVRSVGEPSTPYLHLPASRSSRVSLVVRTTRPASVALPSLRAAVHRLEPAVVFTEDAPAAEVAATTLVPTRIGAALLGAFGTLALLLAAVGLYGVIAYSVSRRTREMGVRTALGAQQSDLVRLVLGHGARLALVGVALGALLAALVGRVFSALLYGVSPLDPLAYGLAAAILIAVSVAANLVPALAAARVDPMRALRSE
jgi:predicted permease